MKDGTGEAMADTVEAGGGAELEGVEGIEGGEVVEAGERARGAPFLRITEIFHSIQGESTWAGLPCTFVRLTGCPLRCVWCDTSYAFQGGIG